MAEPLYEDAVVAEIHAIRAKMLAACDGNHQVLMQQVREHQRSSRRRIIAAPSAIQGTKQGVGPDGK